MSSDATMNTAAIDHAGSAAGEDGREAGEKALAPLDRKVVQKVARTLWTMEFKERSPGATSEERKEAWAAGKKDARLRARKFLRKLEADNVTFAVAGEGRRAAAG